MGSKVSKLLESVREHVDNSASVKKEERETTRVQTTPTKKGVTFLVDDVETCQEHLHSTSCKDSIGFRVNVIIESCSESKSNLVRTGNFHGLVSAVHSAFSSHYPLVLSPDMIWLCIMQGLSIHINQNAEKLRKYFVEHEGKKELEVRMDDFVKGSPTNPWPEVFSEFSEKIKAEIGENTYNLITPDFTTTGPMEKAVTDIVLMEAMETFFDYRGNTICGIPSITLEGTTEDWIAIREKAARLAHYDLEWWTTHLLPALDQFVKASKGEVDKTFWSSIYQYEEQYAQTAVTGWILIFFPYVKYGQFIEDPNDEVDRDRKFRFFGPTTCSVSVKYKPNPVLTNWSYDCGSINKSIMTNELPSGLSASSFKWQIIDESYKMKFIGGFVGVSQDVESMALRPELGWAVVNENDIKNYGCGRLKTANVKIFT